MRLLDKIKDICAERGLSILDLELKAGISENSLYRWNETTPGIDKVKKVADALELTVDDLLE